MIIFDLEIDSTVIFSLLMLIPIFRIKHDLYKLIAALFSIYSDDDDVVNGACLPDLPIVKFEDLQARRHRSVDEMCFVCSEEYGGDDVVSQLSRCKHAFHTDCLLKVQRGDIMSCPFCRCPLFSCPTAAVAAACKQS